MTPQKITKTRLGRERIQIGARSYRRFITYPGPVPEPPIGAPLPNDACSIRVGSAKAGFWLDGVPHQAMPQLNQELA